jgi:hypothetical protein
LIDSSDGRLKLSAPSGNSNPSSIALYGNNGGAFGGSNVVRSKIDSVTDGTAFGANMRFFTNDTSDVYQERMRIDSSGNVGIGTSPNAFSNQTSLTVRGTSVSRIDLQGAGGSGGGVFLATATETQLGGNFNIPLKLFTSSTAGITFETNSNPRMTIDSSGNVGIGNTNPSDLFVGANNLVVGDNSSDNGITIFTGTNNTGYLLFSDGTSGNEQYRGQVRYNNSTDQLQFLTAGDLNTRLAIDSSGKVLVGTETTKGHLTISGDDDLIQANVGIQSQSASASTHYMISFFKSDGSTVGYISHNDTATAYNTSSDYRLKENVVELTGALDRVDQLKPSRFNFIADADTTVDGFLAHEVADVVPEAITGEKDATEEYEVTPAVLDDEGNVIEEAVMGTRPIYQGIDQSKLVPLLVGAIQELRAEIEQLKNQ